MINLVPKNAFVKPKRGAFAGFTRTKRELPTKKKVDGKPEPKKER